jgi:hypothetical protein
MNERIYNLALKAANGMLSYDAEGDFRLSAVEVEKFAELIVRECARVSERTGVLNEARFEGEMIADAIKEDFGVE